MINSKEVLNDKNKEELVPEKVYDSLYIKKAIKIPFWRIYMQTNVIFCESWHPVF